MNMIELFKKHSCEKIWHNYSELYEADFEHLRKKNINILEVGTFRGESINVWLDYFINADIYTIDTFERVHPTALPMLNNIRVKYAVLDSTSKECYDYFKKLNVKFDFIIDDGLHTPDGQRKTFENLIEFTDTYYIEDVWNLDKVSMNHPWIKSHAQDFTHEKWSQLLESIGKYKVTHHDWRSKKKQDSYILKIEK
tara:strand:- start:15750 stop:16337 length:588 start_codon:yes stop_codon:yes gene_type:complete